MLGAAPVAQFFQQTDAPLRVLHALHLIADDSFGPLGSLHQLELHLFRPEPEEAERGKIAGGDFAA